MSKSINLIGDKKKTQLSSLLNKLILLRFIAVGLLFGISVSSLGLFFLISTSPLPQLREQEKQEIANLSQFHTEMGKMLLVKERAQSIKGVLENRTNYDQTLQLLQNELPSGGVITALSMKEKTVTLTIASKSLATIEIFINNMTRGIENKTFSQVTMSNLSVDTEKAEFQVSVELVLL